MQKTGRTVPRGSSRDVHLRDHLHSVQRPGVLVVDREWVLLVGKRPVELSTGLNVWIGVAEGPH